MPVTVKEYDALAETVVPFSVQPENAYPPFAVAETEQTAPAAASPVGQTKLPTNPPDELPTVPLVATCRVIVYAVPAVGAD